jgi:hypothetical protein
MRTASFAVVATIALAACSDMGGMDGANGASGRTLGANLSAQSEVPPNTSAGKGQAQVNYDPTTRKMKYTVNFDGLSGPATMAHFHGPAAPSANAGVVVPIGTQGQPVSSPVSGEVTLDEAKAEQLLNGQWYVNVHTAAHPGGEIRGQVMAR